MRRSALLVIVVGLGTPAFGQTSPADGWSGWAQCVLNVRGSGYSDQQTHTWTLTGGPPTLRGAFRVYAATWSVAGSGSLQRTSGATSDAATWTTTVPPMSAPIQVVLRASDGKLLINSGHSQLRQNGAASGTEQITSDGRTQSVPFVNATYEWAFPAIEDAATATTISGRNSMNVAGSVSPRQAADAVVTAACTWSFARGTASAGVAPPPATGGGSAGASAAGSAPGSPGAASSGGGAAGAQTSSGAGAAGAAAGGAQSGAAGGAAGGGAAGGGAAGAQTSSAGAGAAGAAAGGAQSGAAGGAAGAQTSSTSGGAAGSTSPGGSQTGSAGGSAQSSTNTFAPDQYEPNDTAQQAKFLAGFPANVEPGTFGCPTIPRFPQNYSANFHSPSDTSDWFSIRADDAGVSGICGGMLRIAAAVSNGPSDGTYVIAITEPTVAGLVSRANSAPGPAPSLTYTWSAAQSGASKTFLIEIRHVAGAPSSQNYTLTITWR